MQDNYEAVSEGYSRLSLSSALHRYISLPSAFDQSAQLVPGSGSDTITAMSTTEAEYIALSEAACEAQWLRNLFSELGFAQTLLTTI